MQTFAQIQFQVGAWGAENFGQHETPYLGVCGRGTILRGSPRNVQDRPGAAFHKDTTVVQLGSIASLMCVVGRVGALASAVEMGDTVAVRAAVADIAIAMCDYCCRENICWPEHITPPEHVTPQAAKYSMPTGMLTALGKIHVCHLNYHQRMRGYHVKEYFDTERMCALRAFVWYLDGYAKEVAGNNLLTILNEAWNNIVKKRASPADSNSTPPVNGMEARFNKKV